MFPISSSKLDAQTSRISIVLPSTDLNSPLAVMGPFPGILSLGLYDGILGELVGELESFSGAIIFVVCLFLKKFFQPRICRSTLPSCWRKNVSLWQIASNLPTKL
jgi:hypothetical protein